jgi:hypothetical protein
MNARSSRKQPEPLHAHSPSSKSNSMRKLVIIAFALFCLQLTAAPASAKSIRIGVLVSSPTLQLQCSEARGVFRENASGYDCYASGGIINWNSGGECPRSCTNCFKSSSGNVASLLKPAPVRPKSGTSVTTTVNGNTIVRDHRAASGATSPSALPAVPNVATISSGTTIVRDHRKK